MSRSIEGDRPRPDRIGDMMRTIIAGSRSIFSLTVVEEAVVATGINISHVVSGTAMGIDSLGERWAIEHNIPITRHRPNWDRFGNSAGFIRNKAMAEDAEALLAIWDGKSHGTKHMIQTAKDRGLKIYIHNLKKSVVS